ncbi:MAG: glycosyltransferase family 39 protein [Candidatus Eremiobacteraeota bacterium]|nr:glycosyltransferase family 39 protein [Candidatus Eremiobacteraeota bacterium]
MSRRFWIPLIAAGVTLLIHLIGNAHYGFFRDELYFIICGRHPALGYVDQPPLIPWLAALSQVFGHSLFLLRLLPALCAAGAVFVVCQLVEEFEGGPYAQILAAILTALCPVLTSFGMKISTDMLNLFLWPLIALWLLRLVKGANPRWWLLVGGLLGLSMMSKYSTIFFAAALFIGLLATGSRRAFRTPWFAAGMALSAAIVLPNFLWQAHFEFPMLELLRNGAAGKNIALGPIQYVLQEFLITGPLFAIAWLIGLFALLRHERARWLGYAYVVLITEMIVLHGKHYYPADVYPYLFAAGAATIERWIRGRAWLQFTLASVAVLGGLILISYTLPILPEHSFIAYNKIIKLAGNTETEHTRHGELLWQDWEDMHGWPEMAAQVAAAYEALPTAQRKRTAIWVSNYGDASAIDFFGGTALPPVISGHNQYYLWGTHGFDGQSVIRVGGDISELHRLFAHVTLVARTSAPYAVAIEDHRPIYLCTGIRTPLAAVWSRFKNYE